MIALIASALALTGVTVVMHGAGTAASYRRMLRVWERYRQRPAIGMQLLLAQLVGALLLLHLAEAVVWALFLVAIGALPDIETAAYFSLTSYTTVGYGDVVLPAQWRLLGPLEAGVGVLMLGWSTGILVAVIGNIYRERQP